MDEVLEFVDFLLEVTEGLSLLGDAGYMLVPEEELAHIGVLFMLVGISMDLIMLPTLERIQSQR